MSFDSVQISEFSGEPLELVRIANGATIYRYTSADRDLVISGAVNPDVDGTYLATPGLDIGPIDQTRDIAASQLRITVPRENAVAALFKNAVPDRTVEIDIFRKHESDPEVVNWWNGEIRECRANNDDSLKDLICEHHLAKQKRLGLRMRYHRPCNLVTYGARCGLDREDWRTDAVIDFISGNLLQAPEIELAGADKPDFQDEWFVGGYAERANGERRAIVEQDNAQSQVTLKRPFTSSLVTGETVKLYAGDNLDHVTCREKFENIVNNFSFFTKPKENIFVRGFKQS
jgi:uncharacterized phage protein (TIGR02218 family)